MSLVTYSDSEDDDDDDSDQISKKTSHTHSHSTLSGSKRKRSHDDEQSLHASKPPPLPSSLANLYASNVRSSTNDNPALHQGRRRQIPHIEGNWPSFVYLEWLPPPEDLLRLEDSITSVASGHDFDNSTSQARQHQQVRSSLRSDLGVLQPLHVSLSAPLILTTDNKDTFESTLSQNIQEMHLGSFCTSPSDLRWVTNFDGTRHFLIVTLKKPEHDQLQSLLSMCNRTVASFGLPELYTSRNDLSVRVGVVPSTTIEENHHFGVDAPVDHGCSESSKFHISVAWALAKVSTSQEVLEELTNKLEGVEIKFDKVFIKIGNQVSIVRL